MGFACEVHLCNTMIDLYMKGGSLGDACKLFDQMPYRDIVSWTAMISVYVTDGNVVLASQLFSEMRTAIEPNAVTMLVILQVCSSTIQVIQFHGFLLKKGFLIDRSVVNSLLNAYAHTTTSIHVGDGRECWPEFAPYDAIHVGAAAPEIPKALIDQLKPGGRMAIPVGNIFQDLKVVDKDMDGSIHVHDETYVRYVLLTSREAQLRGR